MELIRASLETGEELADNSNNKELSSHHGRIILANVNEFSSVESAAVFDPWKRTVSHLSMTSIMGPETTCHVEVSSGDVAGSLLDRHQTYLVSVSSQLEKVVRRYRDFYWLHQVLILKYPFRIIPQIPAKGSLAILGGKSQEFMASRRRGLEEFMFLVLNHPILQKESLVIEFISASDFQDVRNRITTSWQEEFATGEHVEPLTVAPTTSKIDWEAFDDAQEWAQKLKLFIGDLKQALSKLSTYNGLLSNEVIVASQSIENISKNTQHEEGAAEKVSKAMESLATPHSRVADDLCRDSLRLELFLRMIIGCQV